jgi:CTP synthase (UTP-ammonia lyase)
MKEAEHTENNPDTILPLITLVSHPVTNRNPGAPRLSGKVKIRLQTGSLAYKIYRRGTVLEEFMCNYELNPLYQPLFEKSQLAITGTGEHGEARIIELPGRKFFLATGFLPQLSRRPDAPHPLILAFLKAVAG